MIGGTGSVSRRELQDRHSGAATEASKTSTTAPTGGDTQHAHASSRPFPAEEDNNNASTQLIFNTPTTATSAASSSSSSSSSSALRQLHQQNVRSFPSSTLVGHPSNQAGENFNSNDNNNSDPAATASTLQREVDLLWKALHEERHVVKMKQEVIGSLEQNLREERVGKAHLERERDSLKSQIEQLRSQVVAASKRSSQSRPSFGAAEGDQQGDGDEEEWSPAAKSLASSRPAQLPIGFAPNASSSSTTAAGGAFSRKPNIFGDQQQHLMFSPNTRAALNTEYLETELNHSAHQMKMYEKKALLLVNEIETETRARLESCFLSEISSTLWEFAGREKRLLLVSEEGQSRARAALGWGEEYASQLREMTSEREEASLRHFRQNFTKLEKEVFVNMQDLARASERTQSHHEQMVKCVSNYQEHLQNLHWQCVFELYRGESSIVRWRNALFAASVHLPKWFESSEELFENSLQSMTELFASSARMLIFQESVKRNRARANSLLHDGGVEGGNSNNSRSNNRKRFGSSQLQRRSSSAAAGGGGGGGFENNDNNDVEGMNSTPNQFHHNNRHLSSRSPATTPRENNGGGGNYYQEGEDNNNNNNNNGGGDEELFERIRHLEGRLAQKTRLIGLHVKRIQELENENDIFKLGNPASIAQYQQQQHQQQNSSSSSSSASSSSSSPASQLLQRQQQQQNQRIRPQSASFSRSLGNINTSRNSGRGQNHQPQQQQDESSSSSSSSSIISGIIPSEVQMLKLYENWQEGITDIVCEMRDDLLSSVRPWARVPRSLLAQMHAASAAASAAAGGGGGNNLLDANSMSSANFEQYQQSHPLMTGSPKSSKTLYIRGISKGDKESYRDIETQAMATALVTSPDNAFESAAAAASGANIFAAERGGAHSSSKHQALLNHFYNYVSMTMLDEAREYSITLLHSLDDLHSAFHRLRPVVRSVDVIKVSLMEGALSLAEAQRDQALTSSHWIHTQAEQAVETLRGLVGKSADASAEKMELTAEEQANQARTQAAARRLEELGGGGERVSNASAAAAAGGNSTMNEVMTAFDNVASQQSAMNDPEQLENQKLAEEFATKCNLLVNRASFLYKRLVERERDVDMLTRQLSELEVREGETRDSSDASVIVQMLEREVADDALVMLREHMLEERMTAQDSIRTLLEENLERNIAIRDLQNLVKELLASCKYAVGLAKHCQHSADAMHGAYYEMGKKLLRTQRAQLLPPISEVSLQMFVAHFEYGDTLFNSHVTMLENAHEAESNVDALVQRRKIYEREMVEMGQEMYRLNQENRLARASVKNFEAWCFSLINDSVVHMQSSTAQIYQSVSKELYDSFAQIEKMKGMLPKNYVSVSERLEQEAFEKKAFEERARLLEKKLTKATTEELEAKQDLNETQAVCAKLDRLRLELESNNNELELLLLQEREAAEGLRDRNLEISEELTSVRNELTSVKRALMTESEAHNATIRNFSSPTGGNRRY